jgi:hypothetical protein
MNRQSERGVIIIIVAVFLLALTLFSALAVDQGILYASRRQAQNAADAGAMAAAIHLMWDGTDVPGARVAARTLAHANPIWGEAPAPADVLVAVPIPCPPGSGVGISCVKVDVFRGGTDDTGGVHTNRLPTIFANLAGITSQEIRATATAQLTGANETDCLRPWFVLNRPSPGYTTNDIGTSIVLDSRIATSGFGKLDVGSGESAVVDAVHGCVSGGHEFAVGQTVATQTGAAGNPTANAVNEVIGWDFNAHYDPDTKTIQGSCAPTCNCAPYICPNVTHRMSPRVFIAPLCDPINDLGCVSGGNGSTHNVTIIGFLSFFIDSAQAHGNDIEIHATLIGGAGTLGPGPTAPNLSAFLLAIRLVR